MKILIICFVFLFQCIQLHAQLAKQYTSLAKTNLVSITSSKDNIIVVGSDNGYIIWTTNSGETWNSSLIDSSYVRAICVVDSSIWYSTLWEGVYKTINGGKNWSKILDGYYYSIKFLDTSIGWVGGWVGGSNKLQKTTDGGITWNDCSLTYFDNYDIYGIKLIGQIGWCIGYSGIIQKTTDGGYTWNYLSSAGGTDYSIGDIDFIDTSIGWAVGGGYESYGIVYKTTDGGSTWFGQTLGNNELIEVQALNASLVFVSGGDGMYKSTDGGNIWSNTETGVTKFNFSDEIHGYGIKGSVIVQTNDSGKTWTNMLYPDTVGTLVHRDNILIPNFQLEQNFPNPFNPTTTIVYQLPVQSAVTLKVFDMLGREFKTLVNDRQSAGFHSVIFNASNLASGFYFYQVQAGSYIATKKLILLK